MFISRLMSVFGYVCSMVSGGFGNYTYRVTLFFLLGCFLFLRVPYVFGLTGFGVYIVFVISPLFLGLFVSRLLDDDLCNFFSGFVPQGTPIWIAPFVCLAETLSYLVRPVVLMIRPFVNLTIGAMGGFVLGMLSFCSWTAFFFLFLLFFYEVFVALVHWFIVCSILSFSEDH